MDVRTSSTADTASGDEDSSSIAADALLSDVDHQQKQLEQSSATAPDVHDGQFARGESESLFLFRKDSSGVGNDEALGGETDSGAVAREREANQQKADELADAEQQRRIDEAADRENEIAIVRQINIELSKTAQDEEQERRVHEYDVAKVQEQLLRAHNTSEAIEAAEQERLRRIVELHDDAALIEQERADHQAAADLAMEKERVRRLSSQEHSEHMATRRKSRSLSSSSQEVGGAPSAPALFTSTLCDSLADTAAAAVPPKHLNDYDDTDEDVNAIIDEQTKHDAHDADEDEGNFYAATESGHSDFSDIPVVHAHASKLLVDEHTEWRCFIASDNPDEERDNLRALRMSLEDELKTETHAKFQELVGDVRLLRFLRGHKMNVSVAATKFREMLAVREKLRIDEIRVAIVDKSLTPDEFPHFQKIIPHLPFLHAYDAASVDGGYALYYEMSGYADFRGLVDDVTDDEWQTFFLYEMEYRALKLDQLSRKCERLVQSVFVRDLTGFSIARFNPRLLKRVQQTLQVATKCYPETTFETIILHTPWVFHKVWNTITDKLLHETQLRKIHMRGADSYAHLLELVGGRDKLPKLLGGRDATHAIPQTGFLGRNSYVLLCEDGATQAEIKAGGSLQLPFRMSVNDTICWEYEVKTHDVDFGVKFRTQGIGGADEAEKVSMTRVAHGTTIAGSFTATEDGTVVLTWDNAFSWTRGKSVAYKAKVVKSTHDFSCLDISGNDCV